MNKNCIVRLIKYKASLKRLKNLGFVKVFSDNLADANGVSPAQVRKDFSLFGITGNKKGGYNIDELISNLSNILGKDKVMEVIIVGAGNIGTALMKYKGFEKENIKIVCAFESDVNKITPEAPIPVLPVDKLPEYIKKHDIRVGILAVGDYSAQDVLDFMIKSGIKGILNFASIRLVAPEEIFITNVNLVIELETMNYFVNAIKKSPAGEDL